MPVKVPAGEAADRQWAVTREEAVGLRARAE